MKKIPRPVTPIYPDTAAGAKEMLINESIFTAADLDRAIHDPYVEGVWKVFHKQPSRHGVTASIVYLAGYHDPFGQVRETNDFEDITPK